MSLLQSLYRHPLSLLTDLYQLTMAYASWKSGLAERQAVFHLFFRSIPFKGGFALSAGLQPAIEFLNDLRFTKEETDYLASLNGADGKPLFEQGFLEFLQNQPFACDIDAMPEGTPVFAHEPMLRVRGPLYQCQLIETPLLNIFNFQTLIATKAARICMAAGGDSVLEFGLRRAQGVDGALSASRAAYLGGASATSNVLAGKLYGIPVKGTHAHSWIMAFADELTAFEAYADAMPNNCVFLVDTFDTLAGVAKAVQVGKRLRQQGHELAGIRLDSGDLAHLSIEARKILDQGGFPQAKIVASNDLNEELILSLKRQGAKIDVWGVGTKLITAYEQPALGGVYKLAAIRSRQGEWQYKIKLSEQKIKVSTPGVLQIQRYCDASGYCLDMIFDQEMGPSKEGVLVDPTVAMRGIKTPENLTPQDLLLPIFRQGSLKYNSPSLDEIRLAVVSEIARLPDGVKRFANPARYQVALESNLYKLKNQLIHEARI